MKIFTYIYIQNKNSNNKDLFVYARCLETVCAELKAKASLKRDKINNNIYKRKDMNKEYITYI